MNIWVAASDGKVDVVEQFLNNGFTANSKDPNGYTPVHAAAAYGHTDLLVLLVKKYGGDINVVDSDGDTPLHHCEDVATAKVIIEELGGDFKAINHEGQTALNSFEEDGEFPDLISYMREKSGIAPGEDNMGISKDQMDMLKNNVRYTLETEPEANDDPQAVERRKRLEQIMQGDNVDEELEAFVREIIRDQMLGAAVAGDDRAFEEPSAKRRK